MPIVFAQPDPMAPDIQAAGGAAEQWSKDMPSLARLYEQAMQGQTQASIASAHNATQMNAAQLGASSHDSQSANALAERRRESEQSMQVSPRDVFHAQQQQQQMQEQAQLHAWLGQQQLSQAESMKLQRMQNAVGEVMADPNLTPEEKTNLAMQLKTGIDPLRQRVEMQKAALEGEMVKKAHHLTAQQQAWEDGNDEQRAAMFQKKTFTFSEEDGKPIMNPETGKPQKFFLNKDGKPLRFPQDATEGKDKTDKEKAPLTDAQVYKEHLPAVVKAVDEEMKQEYKEWQDQQKNAKEGVTVLRPEGKPRAQRVEEEMQKLMDVHKKLAYQTQRAPSTGEPPLAQQPGEPQQPGPNPPANPATGVPEPRDLKPFDWTKPETMAPVQRKQVDLFNTLRKDISSRTDAAGGNALPEKMRWEAEDAVTDMKELLARWGSFKNPKMPDSEKAKLKKAREIIDSLPAKEEVPDAYSGIGAVGSY